MSKDRGNVAHVIGSVLMVVWISLAITGFAYLALHGAVR